MIAFYLELDRIGYAFCSLPFYKFYSPDGVSNTQTVESLWEKLKLRIKHKMGLIEPCSTLMRTLSFISIITNSMTSKINTITAQLITVINKYFKINIYYSLFQSQTRLNPINVINI